MLAASPLPIMKKQVTFSENQKVQRVHQDDVLPRCAGSHESKTALLAANVNFDTGLKIQRLPAARHEPQFQHVTTIHIPKTMTAAPFLKHAQLTPGQKEYLYTVAASCSQERVRNLINQHYLNVLHRCIRAGYDSDRDDFVVSPEVETAPENDESEQPQSKLPDRAKRQGKIHTGAKNPGKPILPKIPTRQIRPSNTSALKQRKSKKHTTKVPTLKRGSPRRSRTELLEEEEDEPDDSLSECFSLLSMGDDDDTFSDL